MLRVAEDPQKEDAAGHGKTGLEITVGLGMVVQFLNLSTQETEAGGSLSPPEGKL